MTILLQQGLNGIASQFVDPLILRVTVMPFDPNPADFVFRQELVQLLPQIYIFYGRLLIAGSPVVFFPVGQPLLDTVHNIPAVGMNHDFAIAAQSFQSFVSATAPLSSFSIPP